MNALPSKTRHLQAVPTPTRGIDADLIAFTVMEHIDTMYPAMWQPVAKTARVSIRNTIVRAVRVAEARHSLEAPPAERGE